MNKWKSDFPIFNRKIHGKPLHYLDSAATAQVPQTVIDTVVDFETNHRANVHRGIHQLSEEATKMYDGSRKTVAKFINAVVSEEIIFTKNTTESINLVAYAWARKNLQQDDIILLTDIEHHSNLVPWQEVCKETGAELKFIPTNNEGQLQLKQINVDWGKVRLVSITQISNVLGSITDIKKVTKFVKKKYKKGEEIPKFFIDAAQAVSHIPINVQKLGADFLAFSGHKMYGPMGIGVLWISRDVMSEFDLFLTGGGAIREVTNISTKYARGTEKFEAGTPNVSGAIGLAAACNYLSSTGMEKIQKHEKSLVEYAMKKLQERDDVIIYGPSDYANRSSVISFNVKGIPSHDLATILDTEGVAVRSGHHCVMPWHMKQEITTTTRMSFGIYNEKEDIDMLISGIDKAHRIFG